MNGLVRKLTILVSLLCSLLLMTKTVVHAQVNSVPDMIENVLPSVVTVGVKSEGIAKIPLGFAGSNSDVAYQRVLDLSGTQGSGSGFVIDFNDKKYVITNAHVVEHALGGDSIVVYSIDQTEYVMKIVGGDSFFDIAVLEFADKKPGKEINTIAFRQDDVHIGEQVFAIGNQLGEYPYTVTDGIISAKNRVSNGVTGKFGYLQSSATTSPGSSGGPLVDTKGNVVGINTRIGMAKQTNIVQPQINFSLEGKLAGRLAREILTNNGRVRRAYLGLEFVQNYECDERGFCGKVDEKPIIGGILPGAPAEVILKNYKGSEVKKINGISIRNIEEVLGEMEKVRPGEVVTFELGQEGKTEIVKVKTSELTKDKLSEIASYVFYQHGGLKLSQGKDRVYMKLSEENKNPLLGESDAATDAGDMIVAAGASEEYLWLIRSMADLGVAVRLSTLNGFVGYFLSTDKSDKPHFLNLSPDERLQQKTLLY